MAAHRFEDLPMSQRVERLELIVATQTDALAALFDKVDALEQAFQAREEATAAKVEEATGRLHVLLTGVQGVTPATSTETAVERVALTGPDPWTQPA